MHLTDRCAKHLSIKYTEELAEAGIEQLRPWRNAIAVELETLSWSSGSTTGGFSNQVGNIPPTEFEAIYDQQAASPVAAGQTEAIHPTENPRRFRSAMVKDVPPC